MDSLTWQQHGGPNVITGQPLMYIYFHFMYFFRIHAPKKNANHTFLKSGFGLTCEYTRRVESVGPQSIFGF